MKSLTQIVILGAGPTGLSMAAQLIRYKIDFIILEKNEKTTHLSKAVAVQARTLEIFQELGISDEAVKQGQVTTAVNLFHNGKQKAAINLTGIGDGLRAFSFVLSLEQSRTEQLLVDFLAANNYCVQWGSTFTQFRENKNAVTVYYTDSKGLSHEIEATYLVGCDGPGSALRHQLGLAFKGDTIPKIFYVADTFLKSSVINRNELYMFMIKKGFILFFPMKPQEHYRIIGVLPEAYDTSQLRDFSSVKDSIKNEIKVPIEFEVVSWFSSYKVHSRKAQSFESGRCFIAGDAAHIHTPAGGQGMNTGIQDAYNLAWKIAYKLKGEVNSEVLKSYNTERNRNARNLLQTTDKLFDLMAGTTSFWRLVRLHFFAVILRMLAHNRAVKKRIFPLLSQTGISYKDSFLTIRSSIANVKAGIRMPHFVFSDGRQILSYLTEPSFKILFFGDKHLNESDELNKIISIISISLTETPKRIFLNEKNFYILLRPDNHISYIGKDIKICKAFLEKIAHI